MTQQAQEGWQQQLSIFSIKEIQQIPYTTRPKRKEEGRQILTTHNHSLQPDMVLGWRPRLPNLPIPLTYTNTYVDSLLSYLPKDDRFKVIYLGPRHPNSVQLNQQFQYNWRYRSRYNANISAVKQAVNRVGNTSQRQKLEHSQNQIEFDSSFESGNLDMAVRVKRNQYDLFLRSDTNTRGHTIWFYFKVNSKDLTGDVQFNICNFGLDKRQSFKGLKPYTLAQGQQWNQQRCFDVDWVQRLCRYGFDHKAFQLQFKYHFSRQNEIVYFAFSIPYTYSRLQSFIKQANLKNNEFVECSKLCQSLGGLEVPLIKITERQQAKQYGIKRKEVVLITGRINPGEPQSSFAIEGLIRHLISDMKSSHTLRKTFICYIIPMMNPDGVVAGNSSTSFSGQDLNQQYNNHNKQVYPETTALIDLINQIKRMNSSRFQFYFNLKGHPSTKGVFCYGSNYLLGSYQFLKCKVLAKCIQDKCQLFNYHQSTFTTEENNELFRGLRIPYCYTFNISKGVNNKSKGKITSFMKKDLLQIGEDIAQGLLLFSSIQANIPKPIIRAKINTGIKNIRMKSQPNSKQFKRRSGSANIRRNSLSNRFVNQKNIHIKTQNTVNAINFTESSLKSIKEISEQIPDPSPQALILKILQQIEREQREQREYKNMDYYYEQSYNFNKHSNNLQQEQLKRLHEFLMNRNFEQNSYFMALNWKRNPVIQLKRLQNKQNNQKNALNSHRTTLYSKYSQQIGIGALGRVKKLQLAQTSKIFRKEHQK